MFNETVGCGRLRERPCVGVIIMMIQIMIMTIFRSKALAKHSIILPVQI